MRVLLPSPFGGGLGGGSKLSRSDTHKKSDASQDFIPPSALRAPSPGGGRIANCDAVVRDLFCHQGNANAALARM
jgi:hypothetical protein